MTSIILTLPLAVTLPRKTVKDKRVILNLNNYRNWAFHQSSDVKLHYCEMMRPQLEGLIVPTPCHLSFKLYKGSKRQGDRANVLCIQEKFVCDALTHFGCWEDDNDDIIISTTYSSGPVDKENPRVELTITHND
jgi:Holliday junction resolvase RusA-like endonuclease